MRYKNRENRIFCARSEPEYHLNMFAAEVMNREFKKDFDSRRIKIVLLPVCMRERAQNECRAVKKNNIITCSRCTESCAICRLSVKLERSGVGTSLIPHSSDFSRFLASWENNKETGLVGIACVLNLLTGGYEMRRLGIASQCVFLDYGGCARHWDARGIPTQVNEKRLYKVLGLT